MNATQHTYRWLRPLGFAIGGATVVAAAIAITASLAAASPPATTHAAKSPTLCASKGGAVTYAKSGKCAKGTKAISIGGQAQVSKLQRQVKSLTKQVAALQTTLQGVTRAKSHGVPTLTLSGENLQIVNGTGDETDVNGLGNLILGYNDNPDGLQRTGSHNLVIGDDNGYASYGGLVAGYGNLISGVYASASGGFGNTASGPYASVSGGTDNTAGGQWATVIGGDNNTATGVEASITGGVLNTASGSGASVLGGYNGSVTSDNCSSIPSNTNTSSQCS